MLTNRNVGSKLSAFVTSSGVTPGGEMVSRGMSLLLRLLITGVMSLAVAPTASAQQLETAPATASSCAGAYAVFREHTNYNGNGLIVCFGDDISNLEAVPAPNGCAGTIIIFGDWHDCISSFKVINANCHHRLRVYVDINYATQMPGPYSGTGSRNISSMGGYNDSMSSLKWTYITSCPT